MQFVDFYMIKKMLRRKICEKQFLKVNFLKQMQKFFFLHFLCEKIRHWFNELYKNSRNLKICVKINSHMLDEKSHKNRLFTIEIDLEATMSHK